MSEKRKFFQRTEDFEQHRSICGQFEILGAPELLVEAAVGIYTIFNPR